jgi:hypothetical protein
MGRALIYVDAAMPRFAGAVCAATIRYAPGTRHGRAACHPISRSPDIVVGGRARVGPTALRRDRLGTAGSRQLEWCRSCRADNKDSLPSPPSLVAQKCAATTSPTWISMQECRSPSCDRNRVSALRPAWKYPAASCCAIVPTGSPIIAVARQNVREREWIESGDGTVVAWRVLPGNSEWIRGFRRFVRLS